MIFPGPVSFVQAPSNTFNVYARDWQDSLFRNALSPTPITWSPGTFPTNSYAGVGYHMELRFYTMTGNGGNGFEANPGQTHFCKLNIGGVDIVTISQFNVNGGGSSPDSGWLVVTDSGTITLSNWTTDFGNYYTPTKLDYRFRRP